MNMSLSHWFSRSWLGSGFMLWSLFWINLLGTIYGYIWYGAQLEYTWTRLSPALLPFVPDSPTASLFFTLFLGYLLMDRKQAGIPHTAIAQVHAEQPTGIVRAVVEAFAVVTSFKYGIWAVVMIWAGAAQGSSIDWRDWMLTISHLGMAAEVLLYWAFYRFRWPAVLLVGLWTLWNDYMDYGIGVHPWLPEVLEDDLTVIGWFTVGLSLVSLGIALAMWRNRKRRFG